MSWTTFIIVNALLFIGVKAYASLIKSYAKNHNVTRRVRIDANTPLSSYSTEEQTAFKIGLSALLIGIVFFLFNMYTVFAALFTGKFLLMLAAIAMLVCCVKINVNK